MNNQIPVSSPEGEPSKPAESPSLRGATRLSALLAALGVVFGDIGTSPLYALKETVHTAAHAEVDAIGIASLIIWTVLIIVGVKYVVLVMKADNQGEGGTIALLSLALSKVPRPLSPAILFVGLAGASLFFGDAMITPAISVLSAMEGLSIAAPVLQPMVLPAACVVLAGLFLLQRHGSAAVGRLFGPIMLLWFVTLAISGAVQVLQRPEVFAALNPLHAYSYLARGPGLATFAILGSAFLAVTGGEALYADMGHFGRQVIRINWFLLVMPALALNYLGQAAIVLAQPQTANPFFDLFPTSLLFPVALLATATTVIASQAVISGAFTLVHQAIQVGHIPRLLVRHTSDEEAGQVYLPQVNWLLAAGVLGLVLGFRSSSALANAYGLAVAGDMLVTTLLLTTVARRNWGWHMASVAVIGVPFLVLDTAFVGSNFQKIADGGWFPLAVGGIALMVALVWRKGRRAMATRQREDAQSLASFLEGLAGLNAPPRVEGISIYLTGQSEIVPPSLLLNVRHNGVLHHRVLLLTIEPYRLPRVEKSERLAAREFGHGVTAVTLRFGFAEEIDVPLALREHRHILGFDPTRATFFVGRTSPASSVREDLSTWEEAVFGFLVQNAVRVSDYFRIPPQQVVELGTRIEL